MTQEFRFGLVGHKISYTLSPLIFDALFDKYGENGVFSVIDTEPGELEREMESLRKLDGFSVTVPYKQKVMSYMTRLSTAAEEIGAVNSVRVHDEKLYGHNTDAGAFIAPLRKMSIDPERILILGHGGAARAVLWALLREYPKAEIAVCGRNLKRAKEFCVDCTGRYGKGKSIAAMTYEMIDGKSNYGLIVNCTPIGGVESPDLSPLPDSFQFAGSPICYDLIYRPARTLFMKRAENAGCGIIGGFPMLVRQAVDSWTIWTGRELDIDDVSRQIISKLNEENKGEIS